MSIFTVANYYCRRSKWDKKNLMANITWVPNVGGRLVLWRSGKAGDRHLL